MDRRSFIYATLLAGAEGAMAKAVRHAPGKKPTAQHSDDSSHQIQKATAAALAMQRRDWEQGILAQALLEAGDSERVILLTKAAMMQQTPDGRLGVVVSGSP